MCWSQVLLLENIATSVKIGKEQLPSVHRLLIEAVCGSRMMLQLVSKKAEIIHPFLLQLLALHDKARSKSCCHGSLCVGPSSEMFFTIVSLLFAGTNAADRAP